MTATTTSTTPSSSRPPPSTETEVEAAAAAVVVLLGAQVTAMFASSSSSSSASSPTTHLPVGRLPQLIRSLENDNEQLPQLGSDSLPLPLPLLAPDELAALERFAEDHPTLELGQQEMLDLLVQMMPPPPPPSAAAAAAAAAADADDDKHDEDDDDEDGPRRAPSTTSTTTTTPTRKRFPSRLPRRTTTTTPGDAAVTDAVKESSTPPSSSSASVEEEAAAGNPASPSTTMDPGATSSSTRGEEGGLRSPSLRRSMASSATTTTTTSSSGGEGEGNRSAETGPARHISSSSNSSRKGRTHRMRSSSGGGGGGGGGIGSDQVDPDSTSASDGSTLASPRASPAAAAAAAADLAPAPEGDATVRAASVTEAKAGAGAGDPPPPRGAPIAWDRGFARPAAPAVVVGRRRSTKLRRSLAAAGAAVAEGSEGGKGSGGGSGSGQPATRKDVEAEADDDGGDDDQGKGETGSKSEATRVEALGADATRTTERRKGRGTPNPLLPSSSSTLMRAAAAENHDDDDNGLPNSAASAPPPTDEAPLVSNDNNDDDSRRFPAAASTNDDDDPHPRRSSPPASPQPPLAPSSLGSRPGTVPSLEPEPDLACRPSQRSAQEEPDHLDLPTLPPPIGLGPPPLPPALTHIGFIGGGGGGGRRLRKARQASYGTGWGVRSTSSTSTTPSAAAAAATEPADNYSQLSRGMPSDLTTTTTTSSSVSFPSSSASSLDPLPSSTNGLGKGIFASRAVTHNDDDQEGQEVTVSPPPRLLRSLTSPSAWSAEADLASDLPAFFGPLRRSGWSTVDEAGDFIGAEDDDDDDDGDHSSGGGSSRQRRRRRQDPSEPSHRGVVTHTHELSVGSDGAIGSGEGNDAFTLLGFRPPSDVSAGRRTTTTTTTPSAASLASLHDALSQAERRNVELSRGLASARAELEARAADNELATAELVGRLEELKVELGQARREEKELRGREANGSRQIAAFEAEIASLHKALDRARTTHSALVKVHHEQLQATEQLRDVVRDRDREALDASETIDNLKADAEKWTEDQRFLETTQARLLAELDLAREAETYLEQQKVENLGLKETIDRLRAELDELRLFAASSGSGGERSTAVGMSRGPSGAGVEEGTMGRSLEKELLRELRAAGSSGVQVDEDVGNDNDGQDVDGAEDDDEGYIETFITTSRRRIRGQRTSSVPKVTVLEQELREFQDVGLQVSPAPKPAGIELSIQTDESALAGLPAYSPRELNDAIVEGERLDDEEPEALDDELARRRRREEGWPPPTGLHRKSRSAPGGTGGALQSLYSSLQQAAARGGKAEREVGGRAGRFDDHGQTGSGLFTLFGQHGAALTILGIALFLAGLHLGPTIIHPSSASLLPTDGTAWETYNNLARGHGVGIGFGQARSAGWVGDVLGVGAAAVGLAGRVPT